MKRALIGIGVFAITFFVALVISYIYILMFLGVFLEFGAIGEEERRTLSVIASVVVAAIIALIATIKINSIKKTKLGNWFALNYPRFILFYIITSILFCSIKSEITWSFDKLKDIVSLEWTMVGLSITIFLVWNVLILKYLKDKQPSKPSDLYPFQERMYIEKKGTFYQTASTMFTSVTLLTINLVVLIIATAMAYVVAEGVTLASQNIAIVSFYFCTNTIIRLFFDILQPLNEERKAMLKATKVTREEVDLQNKINDQISKTFDTMEEIEKLTTISDEQKAGIKMELLHNLTGVSLPPQLEEEKPEVESE